MGSVNGADASTGPDASGRGGGPLRGGSPPVPGSGLELGPKWEAAGPSDPGSTAARVGSLRMKDGASGFGARSARSSSISVFVLW